MRFNRFDPGNFCVRFPITHTHTRRAYITIESSYKTHICFVLTTSNESNKRKKNHRRALLNEAAAFVVTEIQPIFRIHVRTLLFHHSLFCSLLWRVNEYFYWLPLQCFSFIFYSVFRQTLTHGYVSNIPTRCVCVCIWFFVAVSLLWLV